jgi:hypothetical protein
VNSSGVFRARFIPALFLCCAAAFFFSERFIALPGDLGEHDCCGEGCPICLVIQRAENIAEQFKSPAYYPVLPVRALLFAALMVRLAVLFRVPFNSVLLKVKMNR